MDFTWNTSMAIFEGDPWDPQIRKVAMIVISDQNYTFKVEIPQFLASTLQPYGDTPTMTGAHWYARKSRGILMISYLFCICMECTDKQYYGPSPIPTEFNSFNCVCNTEFSFLHYLILCFTACSCNNHDYVYKTGV